MDLGQFVREWMQETNDPTMLLFEGGGGGPEQAWLAELAGPPVCSGVHAELERNDLIINNANRKRLPMAATGNTPGWLWDVLRRPLQSTHRCHRYPINPTISDTIKRPHYSKNAGTKSRTKPSGTTSTTLDPAKAGTYLQLSRRPILNESKKK